MIVLSDEQLKKQDEWKKIILDLDQRLDFAKKAALLKWQKGEPFIQCFQRLLHARTENDKSNDLWTTYRIIQENLINGGVRYMTFQYDEYRNRITRPIESEKRIAKLNVRLWNIAKKMADIANISD